MAGFSFGFGLRSGGVTGGGPPVPEQAIGGVAIGSAGAAGSLVDGYVLSGGDDFDGPLDLIRPSTRFGRYSATRGGYVISGGGPRGSDGLGGADVDPYWTGHEDVGRGAPPASFADSISQGGGRLQLHSRAASIAERALFADPAKTVLSSMIHTGAALMARAPCVFEWRERREAQSYSHMTGWLMQALGFRSFTDIEIDGNEADSGSSGSGDGTAVRPNLNIWTNGSPTPLPGAAPFSPGTAEHTYAIRVDAAGIITWWYDGTLVRTYSAQQAASLSKPFYALFTNHIYAAAMVAAAAGAATDYDILWYRVWRGSTGKHWVAASSAVYQAAFNTPISIVLDDAATVWGDGSVSESVEAFMQDTNEPGGSPTSGGYAAFPDNLTYTAGTRTLAGTVTSRPGRLNIVRYVNQPGDTCEPQRIVLEIGPKINTPLTLNYTVGEAFSYDLYAACDCGVLVVDATGSRAKAVSVSGLPSWATYSPATGLLTGTPTDTGAASLTVSVTNSVGQSATKAVTLAKAAVIVTSFTDDFNRSATETLTASSNWTQMDGPVGAANATQTSGRGNLRSTSAAGISTSAQASFASPDVGTANNYLEIVHQFVGPANSYYVTRLTDSNNWVGFKWTNSTNIQIDSRVAGTFTNAIASYPVPAFAAGDAIRLEMQDGTATLRRNGVVLGSVAIPQVSLPPPSTRQGVVVRNATAEMADTYSTGRL